ncbi:MAG: ABC transporter substrate-binding protein [Pseudomonadota bacterium]
MRTNLRLAVRALLRALSLTSLLSLPLLSLPLLTACGEGAWNNPNAPERGDESIYYSVIYAHPPKHLDPALSYASDESLFLQQIYHPPLGYHFLKRPYELIPLGLESMPEVEFLSADRQPLQKDDPAIAYTRYTLRLRKDQQFQPHPAFARDDNGDSLYLFDSAEASSVYPTVMDFPQRASRGVRAEDYIYGIKRLGDPKLSSPMLGFMGSHIVGLSDFTKRLAALNRSSWVDLSQHDVEGLQRIDDHTFSILINGVYPQFKYWMAMPFLSPIPREVDRFYHNPGFREKNMTLDWWPVGSGPYMMVKNDPNSEIVLARNPNYFEDYYPSEGSPGDAEAGYLADAGKRLPFIDRAHFRLEREVLPLWTKFLQGYYDRSGEVHANTSGYFDQAFVVGPEGLSLTEELRSRNLSISQDVKPSLYYYGFNMRDPVVGGYTEERRKLRRALSIAFDMEEYGNIFYKGNIIAAQSPIPPGIPGAKKGKAGINPYLYDWVDSEPQRKPIDYAKQLMSEAGYPNGRSAETGEPLRLFIDVQSQAISNTSMRWMSRTLGRLGVQVEFRPADWNRTREKYLTGNTQIYSHGWLADYPDPENFLFLMYGPESPLVCNCDGANNSNYENPEFDKKFERMRVLEPGPVRDALIAELVEMWRRDAVWMNAFHPLEYYLNNEWVHNTKRHGISKGTLKYLRLDTDVRARRQAEWNEPVTWPLMAGATSVAALIFPGVVAYRRRQRARIRE